MKKCIFLSTLFLLASALSFSQSEIKFSLGTSISNSSEFSDFISTLSIETYPTYGTYTMTERSSAPRIGADISLSYSYYFKHNIKSFCSLSYQQIGYRGQVAYVFDADFEWEMASYSYSVSEKFDYDYLRTALGATYITDFGMTISLGIVRYSELSANRSWEYFRIYPYLPGQSETGDFDNDISYNYSTYGPMLGLGYELGNFSIDLNYSIIDRIGSFDSRSVSISAGYSMLLIK